MTRSYSSDHDREPTMAASTRRSSSSRCGLMRQRGGVSSFLITFVLCVANIGVVSSSLRTHPRRQPPPRTRGQQQQQQCGAAGATSTDHRMIRRIRPSRQSSSLSWQHAPMLFIRGGGSSSSSGSDSDDDKQKQRQQQSQKNTTSTSSPPAVADVDASTMNATASAQLQQQEDTTTVHNATTTTTARHAETERLGTPDAAAAAAAAAAAVNKANNGTTSTTSPTTTLSQRRLQFLDRVALMSTMLLRREPDAKVNTTQRRLTLRRRRKGRGQDVVDDEDDDDVDEDPMMSLDAITPQSDLTLPGRHIHVVTTAALPWFTGTAVNPLLRAAYLHRRTQQINNHMMNAATMASAAAEEGADTDDDAEDNVARVVETTTAEPNTTTPPSPTASSTMNSTATTNSTGNNNRWVTLVIPWLELPEDQLQLYGRVFASEAEQETYIRDWLRDEADLPDAACPATGLEITFYPARYHTGLGSVFAMGDLISMLDEAKRDVCIVEEPEHCNWYRAPGDGWTKKFNYVVGIVHTNYHQYASAHYSGLWTAPAIAMMSSAMVRAYCHQVIKLSAVLQTYAVEKEVVSNVHGVRSDFLQVAAGGGAGGDSNSSCSTEHQEMATADTNSSDSTILTDNTTTSSTTGITESFSTAAATEVYYIGKLLWAKGLDLMLELEDYYKQCTGNYFAIDIYGSGPEEKEIKRAFLGRQQQQRSSAEDETTDTNQSTNNTPASRGETTIHILGTALSLGGGGSSNRRRPSTSTAKRRNRPKKKVGQRGDSTKSRIRQRWRLLIRRGRGGGNKVPPPADGDDGDDDDDVNQRRRPAAMIAGTMPLQQNATTASVFAAPADASSSSYGGDLPLSSSSKEDGVTSGESLLPSLDELQLKAKQQLEELQLKTRQKLDEIKQTLNTYELPATFAELRRQPVPATFPGRVDHALLKNKYKVFVNPSISEVLCTTTAEALAMGKFVIIPKHPSNTFFLQFPNCLAYRNKFEFAANLRWALTHDPEPLIPALARHFTWEAATDRLIEAAGITRGQALERERLGTQRLDERIAWFHNELGKGATGDMLRQILGAGPVSHQVKYQKLTASVSNKDGTVYDDDASDDDEMEDEDDGLSAKFRKSSFAEAIRSTIGDMSTFLN